MMFTLGLIAGLIAGIVWASTRMRLRMPVLRPSITAGLEGLNAFPEPLALTEGDQILFHNPAFAREISALSALDSWRDWFACVDPSSGIRPEDAPPERAQSTGARAEVQFRTSGGRVLTWTAVPFPGLGRKLVLNIVRDITALVGDDYDIAIFMNRAAHELKTPVTAIKGYAELLEMYVRGNRPVTPEVASRIVEQSNRLVHLVNQLLDVARLGAGRFLDHPGTVNLAATFTEIIGRIRERFPGRTVETDLRAEGNALMDPLRFEQIIRELVINALQYSPAATAVKVALWTEHDMLFFEVADQGIGIPVEEQARIYDRFVRGSNVGEIHGTTGFGLGLFIAQAIIRRWHGDMHITSDRGRGTTVTASWPLRPAPPSHEAQEQAPAVAEETRPTRENSH